MKKNGFQLQDFTVDEILHLMEIYMSEWCHRDQMWQQSFKYFYASLVVLLLPNLSSYLGIDLADFPVVWFRIVGLLVSLVYFYVSLGYTRRLDSVGRAYSNVMNYMPKELRRMSFSKSKTRINRLFSIRMSYVITTVMFLGLFTLAVVMIIHDITA